MKKALSLVFIVVAAAASFSANAKEVMATIINVSPIYSERVQNQQVCDTVYNDQPQQVGAVNSGSVIGGIAGALLGSQAGGGNGKLALTALGAITGAMTGDRLVQQRNNQPQQNCRWVSRSTPEVSNYRVTYQYQQETFQSILPYDPSQGGAVNTITAQMSLSLR